MGMPSACTILIWRHSNNEVENRGQDMNVVNEKEKSLTFIFTADERMFHLKASEMQGP